MMQITIRQQVRQSLALKLTPSGIVVLIPHTLDPDAAVVQHFIAEAIANLPEGEAMSVPITADDLQVLVATWAEKFGVTVTRTQIRPMRKKWGSISTAGTLTLADDLRELPLELIEYVVVHELLHLKFPDHRKGWRVSMGMYLPDWQERAHRLQAYVVEAQ